MFKTVYNEHMSRIKEGHCLPRNAKCRRVCQMPAHCRFSPEQPGAQEAVVLTVEEYEAVRLMDYLGYNQEDAAVQMGVARTTVQRIYAQARQKLSVFLVEGRPLQIGGGSYALCPQESCRGFSRPCGRCASQDGKEASS